MTNVWDWSRISVESLLANTAVDCATECQRIHRRGHAVGCPTRFAFCFIAVTATGRLCCEVELDLCSLRRLLSPHRTTQVWSDRFAGEYAPTPIVAEPHGKAGGDGSWTSPKSANPHLRTMTSVTTRGHVEFTRLSPTRPSNRLAVVCSARRCRAHNNWRPYPQH